MRANKLGVNRTLDEIERALCYYMYIPWYSLQAHQRQRVRKRIIQIIQKELLAELWPAIAQDILHEGAIHVDLHIFKYVHRYIFRKNTRRMLVFLKDILQNEEKSTKRRRVYRKLS